MGEVTLAITWKKILHKVNKSEPRKKTANRKKKKKKKLRGPVLKKENIALKIAQYISKISWSGIPAHIHEEAEIAKNPLEMLFKQFNTGYSPKTGSCPKLSVNQI